MFFLSVFLCTGNIEVCVFEKHFWPRLLRHITYVHTTSMHRRWYVCIATSAWLAPSWPCHDNVWRRSCRNLHNWATKADQWGPLRPRGKWDGLAGDGWDGARYIGNTGQQLTGHLPLPQGSTVYTTQQAKVPRLYFGFTLPPDAGHSVSFLSCVNPEPSPSSTNLRKESSHAPTCHVVPAPYRAILRFVILGGARQTFCSHLYGALPCGR